MPDILFYHLQGQRLESALPILLEKTLQRGWRAVVQVGGEERLKLLDEALWTYRGDSFLPHGRLSDDATEMQPILLTMEETRANTAEALFLVDRAPLPTSYALERIVLMFDGDDPEAVIEARSAWKTVTALGHPATYWQQQQDGRWVKKAGNNK